MDGGAAAAVFDQGLLGGQQALGFALLLLAAVALGLHQAPVLGDQPMSFDRPGERPEERAGGDGLQALVGIGAGLVGIGRQVGFALGAQQQDRLFGAAGAESFDKLQGVELGRSVADQHGVVNLFAERRQSGGRAHGFVHEHSGRAVGSQRPGEPGGQIALGDDVQHPDLGRQAAPGGGQLVSAR